MPLARFSQRGGQEPPDRTRKRGPFGPLHVIIADEWLSPASDKRPPPPQFCGVNHIKVNDRLNLTHFPAIPCSPSPFDACLLLLFRIFAMCTKQTGKRQCLKPLLLSSACLPMWSPPTCPTTQSPRPISRASSRRSMQRSEPLETVSRSPRRLCLNRLCRSRSRSRPII